MAHTVYETKGIVDWATLIGSGLGLVLFVWCTAVTLSQLLEKAVTIFHTLTTHNIRNNCRECAGGGEHVGQDSPTSKSARDFKFYYARRMQECTQQMSIILRPGCARGQDSRRMPSATSGVMLKMNTGGRVAFSGERKTNVGGIARDGPIAAYAD